jgi:hypothetical protein
MKAMMLGVQLATALVAFVLVLALACQSKEELPAQSLQPTKQETVAPTDATAGAVLSKCTPIASGVSHGSVLSAYESTAGQIASWQAPHDGEPGVLDSPFAAFPADERIAVCYLSGEFPKGPPPPAEGTPYPSFDRAVYAIGPGEQITPLLMGYDSNLTPQDGPPVAVATTSASN